LLQKDFDMPLIGVINFIVLWTAKSFMLNIAVPDKVERAGMRKLSLLAGLVAISAGVNATPPASSASYQISVQNEIGIETALHVLPSDGRMHTLPMAGATVEITTPSDTSAVAELKLYSDTAERKLLHTARISGRALPVRVAYSLCNDRVKFMSQAPELKGACAIHSASR
jgi:hypothetical protein